MKKTTFLGTGIAAGLVLAAPAMAQSNVTIYGAIDAGLTYTDNGKAKTTAVTSGVSSASRLGFIGAEDLGGGLKARFQLEAGFDSDTGAMKTYTGNPASATPAAPGGVASSGLFNRRAFVALESQYGTLALGRDYTPLYWALLETDPLRLQLYGNAQQTILLSGTGSDRYGRASNAVFYTTPTWHGLLARGMYSAGSESGGGAGAAPKAANRMKSIAAQYKGESLLLAGAYQELELPTVSRAPLAFTGETEPRKDLVLGAKYTVGDYSVAGGYFHANQPAPNNDSTDVWFGGGVVMGLSTVQVNAHRISQDAVLGRAPRSTVLALSYLYRLSKRSMLYVSYGQSRNNSTGAIALVSNDTAVAPAAAGARVRALTLGINHSL